MIPKNIVQLVKDKGGYFWDPPIDCECACDNSYALDPNFWKALGVALGWTGLSLDLVAPEDAGKIIEPNEWRAYAHDFLDLILQQQPTDSFWQALLEPIDGIRKTI